MTGADRIRYLNGQTTQDVARIAPGTAGYGAVLTGKGKIVGDLFLAAGDDALYLDADLSLRVPLRERLEKFLIADDAVLDDVTEGYVLYHSPAETKPEVTGVPGALAFANARFGVPGWDVWVPKSSPAPFAFSVEGSAPILERLEIERGVGRWGSEIDAETLPQEAALDVAGRGLSYEKGCYVGQETVARIRSLGHVNRRLVRLEQTGGPDDLTPAPLTTGAGEEAGRLTRMALFPDGKRRALGFLKKKYLETPPELQAGERTFRVVG